MRFILAVLLGLMTASAHTTQSSRDWMIYAWGDDEVTYVATRNFNDQMFGEFCDEGPSGQCRWQLRLNAQCPSKHLLYYPVMVHVAGRVSMWEAECAGKAPKSDQYRYVFRTLDYTITNEIKNGASIGFAIPVLPNKFQTERFSLQGAARALEIHSEIRGCRVMAKTLKRRQPECDSTLGR